MINVEQIHYLYNCCKDKKEDIAGFDFDHPSPSLGA